MNCHLSRKPSPSPGRITSALPGASSPPRARVMVMMSTSSPAAALGVARVVELGYGDSGMGPEPPPPGSFCAAAPGEVAERVAAVLEEERADALTVYDPHGGYGHRDHVRVHEAGLLAATAAGT